MSFSTQKENQVTDRFMLIRLNPTRYLNDDLTSSGNLHTATVSFVPNTVSLNGDALTKVSSIGTTDGTWSYSGNILSIYSTNAVSSSNIYTLNHYIYITNRKTRIIPENPESAESSSNPLREWQPRLANTPRIKQSVKNILGGVFSIEDTTIEIVNADAYFLKYLTLKDSFSDTDCQMWLCLDSVENISKVYDGKVKSLRVDNQVVSLDVYDSMTKLSVPCLMGDDASDAYYNKNSFPNLDPDFNSTPIPFIIGPFSRYSKKIPFTGLIQYLGKENTNKGVCLDYENKPSPTACRQWGLYRSEGSIRPPNFGNPDSITQLVDGFGNPTGTYVIAYSASEWASSSLDFDFYDQARIDHGSSHDFGPVIIINDVNREILVVGSQTIGTAGLLSGATISGVSTPAIAIWPKDESSVPIALKYDVDFTVTETTTSGGNKFVKVVFQNNFEVNYAAFTDESTYMHPANYELSYRARPSVTNAGHARVIKDICEDVGLTTNAASFNAAQSALDTLCYFQIPQFDETDFDTCLHYVELILKSTLGTLHLNSNSEVVYKLLAAPTSATTIDTNTYLQDSLRVEVSYQDIITQLIAYNSHNVAKPFRGYTADSSFTVESAKAKYLHGVNRVSRFRHVLYSISSRLQEILDIRSNRRAIYRFKTATKNMDSLLGDDIEVQSPLVLGSASSVDLKIVSLDKSMDDVEIEATDLEDI